MDISIVSKLRAQRFREALEPEPARGTGGSKGCPRKAAERDHVHEHAMTLLEEDRQSGMRIVHMADEVRTDDLIMDRHRRVQELAFRADADIAEPEVGRISELASWPCQRANRLFVTDVGRHDQHPRTRVAAMRSDRLKIVPPARGKHQVPAR